MLTTVKYLTVGGHSLALMEFQEIRTVYLQKNLETILGSNPNMG